MKVSLTRNGKRWIVLIAHKDGTANNYRFKNKREALAWLKIAGVRKEDLK